MKERPIIFNSDMVKAILDGRKTQTRRPINKLLRLGVITEFQVAVTAGFNWMFRNRRKTWNELRHEELISRCPYGQPGDRLWVRETWCRALPSCFLPAFERQEPGRKGVGALYRATPTDGYSAKVPWRPSIHMPRWASRITLEIVSVRVERVGDISYGDVVKEGILTEKEIQSPCVRRQVAFENTWNRIYDLKSIYSWYKNPFVWVIEFKKASER